MGWLIFIIGIIHKFVDGFAIGFAFVSGNESSAISRVIAILSHEIPHVIYKYIT
jgi:zinc transporter ZupT